MDCFPHVQEVPMSWDDGAFTPHFGPKNILYQFPIRFCFYLTRVRDKLMILNMIEYDYGYVLMECYYYFYYYY